MGIKKLLKPAANFRDTTLFIINNPYEINNNNNNDNNNINNI